MELAPYVAAWRQRWQGQLAEDEAARDRALVLADALATLLRDRYGVTRVVLVGSLARGGFRRDSDIDLVVTGLQPADLFRAGAELERQAEGFRVDLVPAESASTDFLAEVAKDGLVLHDTHAR